jgi:protein SCO1/2
MVQTRKPKSQPKVRPGARAHHDARGEQVKGRSAGTAASRGAGAPRATSWAIIGLGAAAVVAVLAASILSVTGGRLGPSTQPVESYGEAKIGGPFTMVDQTGRPVDQRVLLGKWSAVFFGYTYCPDTCPATLAALAATQAQLGAAAKGFQVVFVSVDPARDTPAQMKLYLSSQGFPGGALGLTGTPAEVAGIAKAYAVFYAKAGQGADYQMQHSAMIYLMDPKGKFVRPLIEAQGPSAMAKQIADAMHSD